MVTMLAAERNLADSLTKLQKNSFHMQGNNTEFYLSTERSKVMPMVGFHSYSLVRMTYLRFACIAIYGW